MADGQCQRSLHWDQAASGLLVAKIFPLGPSLWEIAAAGLVCLVQKRGALWALIWNLPLAWEWNFPHTFYFCMSRLLSELGRTEWKYICPVPAGPGWDWAVSSKQANCLQWDEIADRHLLPANPCPFPLWVCRSVCSHHEHSPVSQPETESHRESETQAGRRPHALANTLFGQKAGFVPALSIAIDKHHTFLYFVMFLDTSPSSLYTKPSQHWPQTVVKHTLNVPCSICWTVCELASLVFFTVPGKRLFHKLKTLRSLFLIIKLTLRLVCISCSSAYNTYLPLYNILHACTYRQKPYIFF